MTTKALTVLKRQIREGRFDDDLDAVLNAIVMTVSRRRRAVREGLLGDFAPGQRVLTLPGNYKPRYFANREGTVSFIDEDDGTVWIELDEPILRQRGRIERIGMKGIEYLEILES